MDKLVEGVTGFSAEWDGKRNAGHAPVLQKFTIL
jgi:hypothetical protein